VVPGKSKLLELNSLAKNVVPIRGDSLFEREKKDIRPRLSRKEKRDRPPEGPASEQIEKIGYIFLGSRPRGTQG